MRRFITALFGLIPTGYNAYMNTRARFFATTGLLFFLILFQWMMNYWGFQIINTIIFFVLFGLTCYHWTHPAVVAAVEALEVLRKDKSQKLPPLDENYFKLYLAYILLWLSIVSMFVTTLPFGWYLSFKEAFGLTLVGLMFLSVIAWIAFFKWSEVTIYKKVIKTYAYAGFIVCVWILIPASIKYWATGIEFYGAAGTSETAKEFSETERKIAKEIDEYTAKKIKAVGKKLISGIPFDKLPKDEQELWMNTQKKLKKESLPSKISDGISQIDLSSIRWPWKKESGGFVQPAVYTSPPASYSPPAPVASPPPAPKSEPAICQTPSCWTVVATSEWREFMTVPETGLYKLHCEGDCEAVRLHIGYAELPATVQNKLIIKSGSAFSARSEGGDKKIKLTIKKA